MTRRRPTTILALDPGLRELGFAVLAGRRIVAGGVGDLRRLAQQRRLPEARRLIRGWILAHRPRAIVLERTYRHPTPSLNSLHLLTRWVSHVAAQRQIAVATYAPQTVRRNVAGDGWATKREVAFILASRFPILRVYLTQDRRWKERYFLNLFDAVALALHHQSQLPSRSRSYG